MPLIRLRRLRTCLETPLQCHDSARKARELARARALPPALAARVDAHGLPGPLGSQEGGQPGVQALGTAPPRPWTLVSQRAPHLAAGRAYLLCHDQRLNALALPLDCRALTGLWGAQRLAMDEAWHAVPSPRTWPPATLNRARRFATETWGGARRTHDNPWAEKTRRGRNCPRLSLRLPGALLAGGLGCLLLHAIDRAGAGERSRLFRVARLGIWEYD